MEKILTITIVQGHPVKIEANSILTAAEYDEVIRHLEHMQMNLPKDN